MAFADFAQQIFFGHTAVIQDDRRRRRSADAHLLFFRARLEAWKSALHDERAELFAINLGKDNDDVGKAAVGDPHFLAIQYPLLAVGDSTALVRAFIASEADVDSETHKRQSIRQSPA